MSRYFGEVDDFREAEALRYQTVLLDRIKLSAMHVFSTQMLHDLRVDVTTNVLSDQLLAYITTYVAGDHLAPKSHTFHFKWPASRFQAFKLRHKKLAWWLRPVIYRNESATVSIENVVAFPEFDYPAELGRPIRIQHLRTSGAS